MKKGMFAVVAMPFMKAFLAVLVTLVLMSAVPAFAQPACTSPNMPGYIGNALSGMPVPPTYCGYATGVATTNAGASTQPVADNAPTPLPAGACSSPNMAGYIGNAPSGMPAGSTFCGYGMGVATSNPPAKSTNFGAR